jgi:hypothetical protein
MSVIIKGGVSGVLADVDSDHNLLVNTPTDVTDAGFVALAAEVDSGSIVGTRQIKACDISQDYRLRVGTDTALFYENFTGSAINNQLWTYPNDTMTAAVGSGVIALNSGNNGTSAKYYQLRSWRTFPLYQTYTTYFDCRSIITTINVQTVVEFGFGYAATTAAPTDGAFFRYDATGAFKCVESFAGAETVVTPTSQPSANVYHHWTIGISQDYVEFWVDYELFAVIPTPAAVPSPVGSATQPIFFRIYNSAASSGTTQLKVSDCIVTLGDAQTNKPWPHVLAGYGQNSFQLPTNVAGATTANISNSAAPTNISSPSNTANAYAKIGGDYQVKASATAETDYQIFAYQNIAGTNAISGRVLYVTGVRIAAINFGAVVAVTATTIEWGMGFGSSATDPATADAATTRGPRRIVLGFQYWPVGSVIGSIGTPDSIDTQFTTPYIVEPGMWIHVFVKFVVGTATTSQTIRGAININGYWE